MRVRLRLTVLLNAAAGSIAASESSATLTRVREAFERARLEAEILEIGHDALPAAARQAAASAADVVVLGGGDGTLNTGAAALVGSQKSLGILPLGTLNHFAKDLGIPLDLDQAVGTIERGQVREVDVGEVNGRIFLNNSSIGLYPSAVDQREELRHRHGGGKWPAMFNACLDVFRRFPLLAVTLQVEDRAVALTTPFVFVGNNRYDMRLFSLGTRTRLDGGELSLYLSRNGGRTGLLRLAFRALLGRLAQDRDFHSIMVPEVEIRTRHRSLRVSLDGEVVRMASPMRYRLRPRSLRVLVPVEEPSPAGA
jgi:diacylglycerol kinase family enzyme